LRVLPFRNSAQIPTRWPCRSAPWTTITFGCLTRANRRASVMKRSASERNAPSHRGSNASKRVNARNLHEIFRAGGHVPRVILLVGLVKDARGDHEGVQHTLSAWARSAPPGGGAPRRAGASPATGSTRRAAGRGTRGRTGALCSGTPPGTRPGTRGSGPPGEPVRSSILCLRGFRVALLLKEVRLATTSG